MSQYLCTDRLALFPAATEAVDLHGVRQLAINGLSLLDLVQEFGTPLYLYDRQTMEDAVQSYIDALEAYYPGEAGITYAGKAFLCLAVAEWVSEKNIWLDCTGVNELELGLRAGILRAHLVLHGVSKSREVISAAVRKAGTIVIDNLCELDRFLLIAKGEGREWPDIWLRLRPGLDVSSHTHTQTGGETSKFGLSLAEFETAVVKLIEQEHPPKGLHFHLGSQIHDPAPLLSALDIALDLIAELSLKHGWQPDILCPGGGWGTPYHESDLRHEPINAYVRYLSSRLVSGCSSRNLNLPRLQLEPGRSLVAQAGVAIYQVQAVKYTRNRRWLLVAGRGGR